MEQDILNELYYGRIVPWENGNGQTPERILDNGAELETHMVCEGVKDGSRLGVQLAVAGMEGKKQP